MTSLQPYVSSSGVNSPGLQIHTITLEIRLFFLVIKNFRSGFLLVLLFSFLTEQVPAGTFE
jgi:hypothetical protein